MQKSKGKTEGATNGCGQVSGEKSLLALSVRSWQRSRLQLPALLPFALCLLTFAFALCLTRPTVLNAQGCAMCYTSASAARASAKEALANGVLILLIPPMLFFALIGVVVYMYRNKFREPANWRPEHDHELQELLATLAPATGVQEIRRPSDQAIR